MIWYLSTEIEPEIIMCYYRGDTDHETNSQHLALGLIGQLLQRATTTCQVCKHANVC